MKILQYIDSKADSYVKEEVLALNKAAKEWGWEALFSSSVEQKNAEVADDDLILFHYNGGSLPDFKKLRKGAPSALILHDKPDDDKELRELLPNVELTIGHSEIACDLLEELGAKRIRKVSYLFDSDDVVRDADAAMATMIKESPRNIFFSGRLDDQIDIKNLLMLTWYLSRFIEGSSEQWRLIIESHSNDKDQILQKITELSSQFHLDTASCHILQELTPAQRSTLYNQVDAYVTFDQEDFDGTAIHHANAHGLPVFAVSDAAPQDLLAELVIAEQMISKMAEDIFRTTTDQGYRNRILEAQNVRFASTNFQSTSFVYKSLFSRFLKQ